MRIPLYADTLEEAEGKHQEVQDHERGLKNGQKYVFFFAHFAKLFFVFTFFVHFLIFLNFCFH